MCSETVSYAGKDMAKFWRNLAPVAAICISLAAAVFSGLQWLAMRDQVFLTCNSLDLI
jgi:hypothetical protein